MRVIIFGATGMVGQGVLRECLVDPAVTEVLVIGRSPTGRDDAKLREIIHADFTDFSTIGDDTAGNDLAGYDACFFCLGVSSFGMKEPEYRRITDDVTLAAAHAVLAASPDLTFVYVSGAGTNSGGARCGRGHHRTRRPRRRSGSVDAHALRTLTR